MRRWRFFKIAHYGAIVVLFSVVANWGAHAYSLHRDSALENGLRIHGVTRMVESELRNTVIANQLLVYWAGPTKGATYLLEAANPANITLTIVPRGQEVAKTRSTYPQISTYLQQDAFKAVLSGGGNFGEVGFINADGNAVFQSSKEPKNAFLGFRDRGVQVQIFDSRAGVSLALAKEAGRLVPIEALKS